jgi:hypothetical protein
MVVMGTWCLLTTGTDPWNDLVMSTTSDEAVADLERAIGDTPPGSLHDLEPATITRLTDAVLAERLRQERALRQAVDHALRLVPRPLRGIVKRLIT